MAGLRGPKVKLFSNCFHWKAVAADMQKLEKEMSRTGARPVPTSSQWRRRWIERDFWFLGLYRFCWPTIDSMDRLSICSFRSSPGLCTL